MFKFEKPYMHRVFLGGMPSRAAVEDACARLPCETKLCICRDDNGCCVLGRSVVTAGRGRGRNCEYFIAGRSNE